MEKDESSKSKPASEIRFNQVPGGREELESVSVLLSVLLVGI